MESFEFTTENQKKAKAILAKYPDDQKRSAMLPLLDLAQRQNSNWLSVPAIEYVAEYLGLASIRAMEVATFYTMFNLKPVGKFHVQVCGTTPCWLRGAADLCAAIEKHFGVKIGDTTKNNVFTFSEVECLGACVNAPMVQINDDYYEDLTPETLMKLLDDLAAGKLVKPGSCAGRTGSRAQNVEVTC